MKVIKTCTNCKKEKNEDEFSFYNGKNNKQCKSCRDYFNTKWKNNPNDYTEKRKQYHKDNRERNRLKNFRNDIKKKYGITVETYQNMLKYQNNQCLICELKFIFDRTKENINKLPCIDHCHKTNKVRGLLCRKCNVSLGHIESGFFDKANNYLRVYGSIE